MEYRLMDSRIFRYALVFGLAIVFLAIVMLFLGTNAQAVVIVDQAGGGDYLTIQEGVDNAVPGETVYVWDGSYNENITIDKSVQLIGNGSATTFLDASGLNNNAVNITAEGVEITGLNITNTGISYGIWSSVGGFNIHDNTFNTQDYAIYMDINKLNSGSTTVGDIIVDNNEIIGTHGFLFNIEIEEPLPGSDFVFGKTVITNNTLSNTQTGIDIDRYTVFSMDQGSITWDDIIVKDNFVYSDSSGIFFWGIFWNITDVNIDLGIMDFSGNNITAQSNGIFIDWWDFAEGIYGNTIATTQDTYVYNNDIVSQSGSGIYLQTDVIGHILYDSTSVTTGDFYIYSNNITTTSTSLSDGGIYLRLYEIAREVYNDSSVNFGNIYIDSNIVDSNTHGILLRYLNSCGTDAYDNALVNIGDVHITNNEILSVNHGVSISFDTVGNTMYDQVSSIIGNILITRNNITATADGINLYMVSTAYNMYNDSSVDIGDYYFDSNIINAGRYGIYFETDVFGSYLYGNAQVTSGDILITHNNVNSSDHGIYLLRTFCGEVMYGLSSLSFGNIIIDDNEILSGGNGIYLYMRHDGIFMWNDAYMTMGYFTMNSNNITSVLKGIFIYVEDVAQAMYNNTMLSMGDFTINYNTINSTTDAGINFWLMDIANDMAGNSTITFGNFLFINNNITAFSDGIWFGVYDIGYNMRDWAVVTMKDFILNDNILECGPSGNVILSDFENIGGSMYGDSYISLGSWNIEDNIILSGYYGIHVWSQNWCYDMVDNSNLMYGDFFIINNVVNVTGYRGIGIECLDIGMNMAGTSSVTGGNMSIINNIVSSRDQSGLLFWYGPIGNILNDFSIVSIGWIDISYNNFSSISNYGAYISIYRLGYDMVGNSQAYFGDIMFTNNNVRSDTMDALHFYQFYQNAYLMYDDSYIQIGNILVNDNNLSAGGTGDGIELFQWTDNAFEMYYNVSAYFGNFEFQRNSIEANGSGIKLQELGLLGNYLNGTSICVFGDFIIEDNTINASNDGLYINAYDWGETLSHNSSVTFGDFSVSNNIIESGYRGIFFQLDPAGYGMFDMARFEMGSVIVSNNTILSGIDPASINSYGISIWTRSVGYDMAGESQTIIGSILVNDNDITVLFGTNADGINIYRIAYYGYLMYDRASFTMNGNIEVCRNTINTTNGDEGISCDIYNLGTYLYGDNTASYGNLLFNDNTIIDAYNAGLYITVSYIGHITYGNSSVTVGNIEVNNNDDIQIVDGSYFSGIYIYLGDIGSNMSDGSIFNMGHFQMNDNNIYNSSGYGLEIEAFRLGYEMYNSSSAYFGNFEFLRNNITSRDEGIFLFGFEYFAAYMYNNASAFFRDFLINNNIISTTDPGGDGIYIDAFRFLGYQMNGQSYAEFGNFECSVNEVDVPSLAYGISISALACANNMYDNATFIMGDWLINNNTVFTSEYEGIRFDCDSFGYDLYDNSSAYLGKNEIMYNTVNSTGGVGIETRWWYGFGNYMYDYSYFEVGSCYIMFNNITSTSSLHYGLQTGLFSIGEFVRDEAEAYFGDYIISNNIIYSEGTEGIYLWYDHVGYWLDNTNLPECRAVVEVGRVMVTDNIITVPNGKGIYIDGWDVAYSANDYSSVITGGIHINRNTINSYDHGIDIYIYELGENNGNNAQVWLGSFVIDDNVINATNGNGIYIYSEFFAYSTHDSAFIHMDDIFITNNNIVAGITGIELTCEWWVELYTSSSARAPGLWVTGNNVSAPASAFNYTTIRTPTRIDPGTTFSSGNVTISDNIFDGGLFGVMIDWRDMLPTGEGQPDFYFENNSIENGAANSIGLYMMNIQNSTIESLYLDSYDQGIYVSNSNIWFMFNSTISNIPSYDLNLSSSSFIGAVNTTFDNASVYFEDYDCLLNVGWFMNVFVQSQVFLPVPEANLTVKDVDGTEVFNGTTNLNGRAFYIICWEYQENITGIIKNFNDYTADANKAGSFGSAVPNPTMNQTRLVVITLTDFIPPTIFSDNSDTAGTTGDPFYFEINASDNMGIVSVHVNYRFDGVGPYTNLTMTGTGPYWLNEIMPSNYVGFIEYYFTAVDSGGFWVNTTPTTAPITDNDPPTYTWISQPSAGTTGESVLVSLLATDNIDLTYYKIDIDGVLYDLIKDGDYYNYTINIPSDSAAPITYSIILNDSANNPNIITPPMITVTDNDQPTFSWVSQPISGTTGESVLVSILATDNIGITYYKIDIDGMLYDLIKDGDYYNYTINIPSDSAADITYSLILNDSAGNPNIISPPVITVTDNDQPTYSWVSQPFSGTTGESVLVSILATDNIDITYYKIEIDGILYDLTKDGDYYNYTINIPLDSTASITYRLIINDSDNNPNIIPDTVIVVTDNDAPTYNWVSKPTGGVVGSSVLVSLNAYDNIGIINYTIYIDGVPFDMVKDGDYYNYTIDIPPGAPVDIIYNVTFRDAEGYIVETGDTVIGVVTVDIDPPEYSWILHPATGTTGESVLISLLATDNIGITYYKIEIDSTIYDLIKDGDYYNYTITIPTDSLASITYNIVFNDSANNPNSTAPTVITVTDNDSPTNLDDASDTLATTGDSFTFTVNATDNIDVTEAHVIWWFGSGVPTNDTMTGEDPFTLSIPVPPDSIDSLHYYFTITDAAGNWLVGPQVDINVTDNDAPTFVSDGSDTSANAGVDFNFVADFTDNIGITETYVIYWFDSGSETNESMMGPSPFTKTISIQTGPGELHYYFAARDDAGNWMTSPQVDITIGSVDNPPQLVSDDSDTEATTGDSFEFEVTLSDDIGISNVYVVYWFGSGSKTNATMSGTDTYTLTITIPSDSLDTLHYYFTASDTGGNWFVGIQNDITVVDNDGPTDIVNNSQMTATTGDDFTFNISASDNIEVTQVEIFYWFGDGEVLDYLVVGSSPFTYTISIPVNSTQTLHYYFVVSDAAGNTKQSNQVDIAVTDNDPGSISNPASDTSGQKGKEFRFQIDALDNIGISEVKVWYWFGDDDSQKKSLTLEESDGTYSGSFIPDESGTLHYYFEVTDEAGNTFESSENTVDIASEPEEEETNILPWILLVILIVVIILFFLLTRKRKEPEEVVEAEPEEEIEERELEEGAEDLEEEAEFEEMEPSEEIEPEEELGEEGIEEEEIGGIEFEEEPEESLEEEAEFEEIEPEEELEAEPEEGLEKEE